MLRSLMKQPKRYTTAVNTCMYKLMDRPSDEKLPATRTYSSDEKLPATRRYTSDAGMNENHVSDLAWEQLVDYSKLSPEELRIHQAHHRAIQDKKECYTDPSTGYHVMTRLAHINRGECCGNACRHCPYGQAKVPEEQKGKKRFNSAFYV